LFSFLLLVCFKSPLAKFFCLFKKFRLNRVKLNWAARLSIVLVAVFFSSLFPLSQSSLEVLLLSLELDRLPSSFFCKDKSSTLLGLWGLAAAWLEGASAVKQIENIIAVTEINFSAQVKSFLTYFERRLSLRLSLVYTKNTCILK